MNNFGVIEVASTKTTNAPGWAYVPDTPAHAIPSQSVSAVHLHVNRSKRAARAGGGASSQQQQHNDISARHDAKLHKEIEQLQRDSIAGQPTIPVPSGGQRDKDGKIRGHTPNVRRILASQKTFANHLDDFEAWSRTQATQETVGGSAGQSAAGTPAPSVPSAAGGAKKAVTASAVQKKGGNSSSSKARSTSNSNKKSATPAPDLDVVMTDAPSPSEDQRQDSTIDGNKEQSESQFLTPFTHFRPAPRPNDADPSPEPWPSTHHPGDDNPLLESWLPPLPTDDELRELIRAPPLRYTQARGVWPEDDEEGGRYPARRFCEVCGYWGRVRCMKCGTRVCALDCLDVHREECVTRYGL